MPDTNANGYIKQCKNVSSNFSSIDPGEAVWMPGHIGVYIGNGEVIEATPSWKNGVQKTKLSARRWEKHGLMPQIEYTQGQAEVLELLRTTENLHMRSSAGTSHESILVIPKGTDVQVISKTSTWAKVSYKSKTGYSSMSFLKSPATRMGGKVIASALNVRSGPGTSHRIKDVLYKSEPVEIIRTVNGWHEIRHGTATAYVSADYIEESNAIAIVTRCGVVYNCSYLNIRQTPGGKSVGTYKAGTTVTILAREGSWYKTDKGYSHVNYIKLI